MKRAESSETRKQPSKNEIVFNNHFDVPFEDRHRHEFVDLDELLSEPWVAGWKTTFKGRHVFWRWALSDHYLMAEYDNGQFWFVIGWVRFPERLELPRVAEGEYTNRLRSAKKS